MTFPVWEIPWIGAELPRIAVGYLLSVAGAFAAGSALWMVLLEHRAQREGHQPLLSFLQDWSRFVLLMTVILGAGLAAGAWQVAAVTRPWTSVALARSLFWVWGTAWAFGVTWLAAALLYASGWGVTGPRHHLAAGWIAVGSSWMLLFTLTAVVALLGEPGGWVRTGHLADACFNVTFNPLLLLHAGYALGVGGLFPLVAGIAMEPPRLRAVLVRASAWCVALGFLAVGLGEAWNAMVLPPAAREALAGAGDLAPAVLYATIAGAAVIAAFAAVGPLLRPEGAARAQALLLLVLGLLTLGGSGWLRAAARAPHAIPGLLEANGIDVRPGPAARRSFLAREPWAVVRAVGRDPGPAGAELFRFQCAPCHTLHGWRGVVPLVRGWDEAMIARQLEHLAGLRGPMPGFTGSDAERRALAHWLAGKAAAP